MPTIKDIAKIAGVSHGTVSNVLNKTGKVSVEKIRLVEETAKKLGYTPNSQAQLLRQGAAKTIAIIVPSLQVSLYLDLYSSIQTALMVHNMDTIVHTTDDIPSQELSILDKISTSNIVAIITVSCLCEQQDNPYNLLNCPVIFIDRSPTQLLKTHYFASFDYQMAGNSIAQKIMNENHKKVCFFTTPSYINANQKNTLFQTLHNAFIHTDIYLQKFSSDLHFVVSKAFEILQEQIPFDCIITSDTFRTQAILTVYKLLHVEKLPTIISIDSFQNLQISPFYTTYYTDYNEMAYFVATKIVDFLKSSNALPKETFLPCKGFLFDFSYKASKQLTRTLSLLTLESPSASALEKLRPIFEATSGIKLNICSLTYDDLLSLLSMGSDKLDFDLIRMDVAWLSTIGKDVYLPLDKLGIRFDQFPKMLTEHALKYYSCIEDKQYAFPFDPSVQILLYRKDLFQDATIARIFYEKYRKPLAIPKTIDEYKQVADFFTKNINIDSPTLYGTTQTTQASTVASCDFMPFFLANDGTLIDKNGEISLDTPEMISAMQKYKDMFTCSSQEKWWSDSIKTFASGESAMTTIFSNYASYVINSKHSLAAGCTAAAILPGEHPLLGGGIIGFGKNTKNIDCCKEFLTWYYSEDISTILVQMGITSPLMNAYDNHKNNYIFPWLELTKKSFSLATRGTGTSANLSHIEFSIGSAVKNLLAGTMDPKQASSYAQSLFTQVSQKTFFPINSR